MPVDIGDSFEVVGPDGTKDRVRDIARRRDATGLADDRRSAIPGLPEYVLVSSRHRLNAVDDNTFKDVTTGAIWKRLV